MFSHLKESTIFTFKAVVTFFTFFFFGIAALSGWLRGFPLVDKWLYSFFLSKVIIVVLGLLITPIPLWILILLSFLPPPVIAPVFFVAFIMMFAHF